MLAKTADLWPRGGLSSGLPGRHARGSADQCGDKVKEDEKKLGVYVKRQMVQTKQSLSVQHIQSHITPL